MICTFFWTQEHKRINKNKVKEHNTNCHKWIEKSIKKGLVVINL